MASPHPKLHTVELARGLASAAVVAFHTNSAARYMGHDFIPWLLPGEHGVDFFFVLSGFIIFFVHRNDIGRPGRARDYLVKRFVRLYPIIWLVVGGCLLVKLLIGDLPSLAAIGTSLALYPSLEQPYPIVLWTLRHELIFYLAFLVLVLNRTAGLLLFGSWAAICCVQLALVATGRPLEGLAAFFTSAFQLDFLMGALLAQAHRRWSFTASFRPLIIGLALVVACVIGEQAIPFHRYGVLDYVSLPAAFGTLALGIAFTITLHGFLCIEPVVRVPRAFLLLGSASYAIYLIHTPLNSLSQRVAFVLPSGLSHLFVALVGLGGGIALHLLIEKPLTHWLRKRLLRPRPSAPATPVPHNTIAET